MKDKSIQGEIREGVEYTIMINRPYLASDITDKILKYLDKKNVVVATWHEGELYDGFERLVEE